MTVPKSLGSAVVTIALGFTSITPLPVTVTLPLSGADDPGTTRTAQPLPVAPDGGIVVGQVRAGGTVVVVAELRPGTWVYEYVIFQLPAAVVAASAEIDSCTRSRSLRVRGLMRSGPRAACPRRHEADRHPDCREQQQRCSHQDERSSTGPERDGRRFLVEKRTIVVTDREPTRTDRVRPILTGVRWPLGNPAKDAPEPFLEVVVFRHDSALPLHQGLLHPAAFAGRQCHGEVMT